MMTLNPGTAAANAAQALQRAELGVVPLTEPQMFELRAPLEVLLYGTTLRIPAGFRFDFASVPGPIKWIFPSRAIFSAAALVHDYLYKTGCCTRWEADAVFYSLLAAERLGVVVRTIMWLGVRLGGWAAWRQHRAGNNGVTE